MKARELIEGSVYGPRAVKLMAQAFDAAWERVAHNFDGDDTQIALARERLAHAILAITHGDTPDPDLIECTALNVLALGYGKPLATPQG